MNRDGVAAAFELIIEEIETVASEIADQGAKAFKDKSYNVAQQLGESGKSLQDFREQVEKLLESWQSGIDVSTRQRFTERHLTTKPKTITTHSKAAKTRLRVRFPDGRIIEEYYAADTFALALQHLGLQRVEDLGLTEAKLPLVGSIRSDDYGQRRIDGRYICTHSSTQKKKETLERVGKKLGVALKVEVIHPSIDNIL